MAVAVKCRTCRHVTDEASGCLQHHVSVLCGIIGEGLVENSRAAAALEQGSTICSQNSHRSEWKEPYMRGHLSIPQGCSRKLRNPISTDVNTTLRVSPHTVDFSTANLVDFAVDSFWISPIYIERGEIYG